MIAEKILTLVFCHYLGDFFFQTDYIAKTKGRNWYHLFVHCVLYCLGFYVCFGLSWHLVAMFISHWVIDAAKARYALFGIKTDQALHLMLLLVYFL